MLDNILYSVNNLRLSVELFDGGVSHIVAAALQTKGIIDQAKILDNLTELNSIASLFYLFAIAMAVGAVAIFGNYRQGVYLLIGPALYMYMVTTKVQTDGITAKVGNYEIPNSIGKQTAFLKHIKAIGSNEDPKTREVSLFYAAFDGIATEVIQKVVSFLLNTDNQDHLRFVARERALAYALMAIPDSGAIPALVSRHQGECSKAIMNFISSGKDTKRLLGNKARSHADVQKVKNIAEKAWGEETIVLGGEDNQIKRFLIGMKKEKGFENVSISDPSEDLPTTCEQMWQWIGTSLVLYAQKNLKPDSYKGSQEQETHEPKARAYDDVREALGSGGDGDPEVVLASYIYKNIMGQTTHSALNSQMFSNSPFNSKDFKTTFKDMPGSEARGGYFGMKYFATTIPYLQGLMLYMLTIAFPFFAILLVIPGKAMSFIMWCSLWVWVKSWDIGFALVNVIRDILWHMLKYRTNTYENIVDWSDPSSIFGIILNNNPLATENTYWEIISFLTVSVPFLTAHFCLGASNMFDMFRGSIDQTSGRFRTWETKSGQRGIGNNTEIEMAQHSGAIATAFAMSNFNNSSATTMSGQELASDTAAGMSDVSNLGKISGKRKDRANAAFQMANALVQIGDKSLQRQLTNQLAQLENFENATNKANGVKSNAKSYTLPKSFSPVEIDKKTGQSYVTLDDKVPESYLNKRKEDGASGKDDKKNSDWIDNKKPYKWSEFIKEDAKNRGEKVVMPHVMKGMTRLEEEISPQELAKIRKDISSISHTQESALGDLGKNGERVTWGQVFEKATEEQADYHAYLGMMAGRRHAPPVSMAGGNIQAASGIEAGIELTGRVVAAGTKDAGVYNLPEAEWFMNSALKATTGIEAKINPEKGGDAPSPSVDGASNNSKIGY